MKPVSEGSSVGVAIVTAESNYGTPIARNTPLDRTLPDEQADPAETAKPARSIAITCVSPFHPGVRMDSVCGRRRDSRPGNIVFPS